MSKSSRLTDFYQFLYTNKEACDIRASHTCYVSRETKTNLPTMCDIFELATDAALVVVDSGATQTVGGTRICPFSDPTSHVTRNG